jgi:hypothetical protein
MSLISAKTFAQSDWPPPEYKGFSDQWFQMRSESKAAESEFFYSSPHLIPEVGYADERNPHAVRRLLDELEANRKSRRTAWATLQRLRKFLEANDARIPVPDDRTFETEGEVIESGLRRTVEGREMVVRDLIRAVHRFRDATLVAEKKDDFGNALQNLYRELERAEELVGPSLIVRGAVTIDFLRAKGDQVD